VLEDGRDGIAALAEADALPQGDALSELSREIPQNERLDRPEVP
jgi:hypothetical protein